MFATALQRHFDTLHLLFQNLQTGNLQEIKRNMWLQLQEEEKLRATLLSKEHVSPVEYISEFLSTIIFLTYCNQQVWYR